MCTIILIVITSILIVIVIIIINFILQASVTTSACEVKNYILPVPGMFRCPSNFHLLKIIQRLTTQSSSSSKLSTLIVYWLKNICPAVIYVERNILSLPDFKKDFGGKGCFLSTRSGLCRLGLGYWWSLGLPPYKHFVQNPGNKKLHWISTNSNRMTHTRVGKCIQQDTPAVCCTANAKGINKRSET